MSGVSNDKKSGNSDIPMLIYGTNNNFLYFKQKLSVTRFQLYGHLAIFFGQGKCMCPMRSMFDDYDLDDDPDDLNLDGLREKTN